MSRTSRRGRRGNGREMYGKPDGASADEEKIVVTDENGDVLEAPEGEEPEVVVARDDADHPDSKPNTRQNEDWEAILRERDELKAAREQDSRRLREYEQRVSAEQYDRRATEKAVLELAAQNEAHALAQAKRRLAESMQAGDYDAAAEAQTAISQHMINAHQFQTARDQLETAPAPQQRQTQPRAAESDDEYFGNLPPRAKEWVRKNRDVVLASSESKEKLARAHYSALAEGHRPETDEYFHHIDQKMGFAEGGKVKTARKAVPSAPVSRGASVRGHTVLSLTDAQKEAARRMGMSFTAYAKNLDALEQHSHRDDWNGPRLSRNDPRQFQGR